MLISENAVYLSSLSTEVIDSGDDMIIEEIDLEDFGFDVSSDESSTEQEGIFQARKEGDTSDAEDSDSSRWQEAASKKKSKKASASKKKKEKEEAAEEESPSSQEEKEKEEKTQKESPETDTKTPGSQTDTVPPLIHYENFEAGMTYTGIVNPRIIVTDSNLDQKRCQMFLYYSDGSRAFSLEERMKSDRSEKNKIIFYWEDFPHKKETDNQYFLKIEAFDTEGNASKACEQLRFFVDRYGARYSLPSETEEYVHQYYHKKEQDITCIVYSLHPIFSRISYTHDKKEKKILKKEEYTVSSTYLLNKEQNLLLPDPHQNWIQTVYKISADVFSQEGEYQILIESKEVDFHNHDENYLQMMSLLGEESKNSEYSILTESENTKWTETLTFAIDKTPPAVTISELHNSKKKESDGFTITAFDYSNIKYFKINLKEKENTDHTFRNSDTEASGVTSMLFTEKDFNENHSLILESQDYKGYEITGYEACDYAGNEIKRDKLILQEDEILSPASIVRDYYLHPVISGMFTFMGSLFLMLMILVLKRKSIFDILKKI